MRHIKLQHEVVHARYAEDTGKWHVRVRRPSPSADGGEELEEFEDVADVLLTAVGALTRWHLPDIPGIGAFKGELHHTAGFNPDTPTWAEEAAKWGNKRVGVVGSVRLPSPAASMVRAR